ncbi:MAG TPA: DUF3558 domain-containing protein [Pseudonocardiaceae bacterium]|nr:DUF3558 domain-containing protein [Pseudonocardiaceae bacterium]
MRSRALIVVVFGCLLAVGCTTSTQGSASPAGGGAAPTGPAATGSTPATPSQAGDYGAPKVTTPLDTAKWQHNPCTTLTTAQQHAIGITAPGEVQVSDLGNICQWTIQYNVIYGIGFNVKFNPGEPPGLANAYYNAGPGAMRRLPDVDGVPAATEPSQNTDGSCTIYLGATDQVEYAASVQIGPDQAHYQNPCSVAQQIADSATATMRSGKS